MKHFIERQLNLLDYALSSLWRRKLKNFGIMAVFAGVIFLVASFQLLTRGLIDLSGRLLEDVPDIVVQKMSAGRQEAIPRSYQRRIEEGIFGIRAIVPRIWGYYFDETSGANYTVLAQDFAALPPGDKLAKAVAGQFIDQKSGTVLLGQGVAASMHLAGRRVISFFRPDLTLKPLRVAGIFKEDTDILTADLVVMGMADGRDLFDISEDLVTDFCVYVSNPTEVETIARKISQRLPATRVLTRHQIQQTYNVVFGWRSGFASICLLAALAAFIILAWDKASGLSPEEKREIGILKVIGWQTSDILVLRFWESLVVSGLALTIGALAAYVHVLFFEGSLFRPVLVGWSVIHPALKILPGFTGGDLLLITTFTVMPYMAATVIPAWRSSIVSPDAAIK